MGMLHGVGPGIAHEHGASPFQLPSSAKVVPRASGKAALRNGPHHAPGIGHTGDHPPSQKLNRGLRSRAGPAAARTISWQMGRQSRRANARLTAIGHGPGRNSWAVQDRANVTIGKCRFTMMASVGHESRARDSIDAAGCPRPNSSHIPPLPPPGPLTSRRNGVELRAGPRSGCHPPRQEGAQGGGGGGGGAASRRKLRRPHVRKQKRPPSAYSSCTSGIWRKFEIGLVARGNRGQVELARQPRFPIPYVLCSIRLSAGTARRIGHMARLVRARVATRST